MEKQRISEIGKTKELWPEQLGKQGQEIWEVEPSTELSPVLLVKQILEVGQLKELSPELLVKQGKTISVVGPLTELSRVQMEKQGKGISEVGL